MKEEIYGVSLLWLVISGSAEGKRVSTMVEPCRSLSCLFNSLFFKRKTVVISDSHVLSRFLLLFVQESISAVKGGKVKVAAF